MEKLLEEAFKKASLLPEKDKKAFGAFILEELEHEEKWDNLFQEYQSGLTTLAKEALSEYKKGNAEELDPDKF